MSYELNKTDGTTILQLDDGIVDSVSASIKFVGRNVVNYGEIQNENFLHMLENFANNSAPDFPIRGQLWFDASDATLRLKLYDGVVWRQVPTIEYNSTSTGQTIGDLWFSTTQGQLFVKTGSGHILIGPNSNATTSNKLLNPAKINGVDFDGSYNITITAATPAALTAGNYLSGNPFTGGAPVTWTVDVGTVSEPTPFKVVARNSSGDIWYNEGHGVSSSSKYADLAEKYLADQYYAPGTVVSIGGEREVRASYHGERAIGVVSGNPGYKMNSDLEDGTYIALKGRVPVMITGEVSKGDQLIATGIGKACKGQGPMVFAIALENSNGREIIEALVL